MPRSLRRQLERFHKQDPDCHWCHKPTTLYSIQSLRAWPKRKPLPNHMATIDHLYSRMDDRRFNQMGGGHISHVLSCRECNLKRSHKELAEKVELQRYKSNPHFKYRRDLHAD